MCVEGGGGAVTAADPRDYYPAMGLVSLLQRAAADANTPRRLDRWFLADGHRLVSI